MNKEETKRWLHHEIVVADCARKAGIWDDKKFDEVVDECIDEALEMLSDNEEER